MAGGWRPGGAAEGGVVTGAGAAAVLARAADAIDGQADDVARLAVVADVQAGVETARAVGR